MVEADLAFQGIDLRDLYRPGSGLTPRRLLVLIRALPPTAALWAVLEREVSKPDAQLIRERQQHYAKGG